MGEFEALLGVNPVTALFTLANTIALFLVMKKFLWSKILKMIEDRQNEIDGMYTEAGKAKAEAEQLRRAYEKELSEAAQTGDRLVKEAVARGQSREEEILRKANAQADAIRQKASEDIAREKKKAINDAKDEIAGIAMEIAGKVVGKSLDEQDQSALVDQFIDRLGDGV